MYTPDMLQQEIVARGDEIFDNTSPVRITSFADFHALLFEMARRQIHHTSQ
jgi:hypothetical protein